VLVGGDSDLLLMAMASGAVARGAGTGLPAHLQTPPTPPGRRKSPSKSAATAEQQPVPRPMVRGMDASAVDLGVTDLGARGAGLHFSSPKFALALEASLRRAAEERAASAQAVGPQNTWQKAVQGAAHNTSQKASPGSQNTSKGALRPASQASPGVPRVAVHEASLDLVALLVLGSGNDYIPAMNGLSANPSTLWESYLSAIAAPPPILPMSAFVTEAKANAGGALDGAAGISPDKNPKKKKKKATGSKTEAGAAAAEAVAAVWAASVSGPGPLVLTECGGQRDGLEHSGIVEPGKSGNSNVGPGETWGGNWRGVGWKGSRISRSALAALLSHQDAHGGLSPMPPSALEVRRKRELPQRKHTRACVLALGH